MFMKLYNSISEIPIPETLTGRVAIKLHMGDKENKTFLKPGEVRPVFNKLKELGRPFLFDTTTLYKRERYTPDGYKEVAKLHGFGEFPIVIARDDRVKWVESGGLRIPLPEQLLEADSLLILSHATGHIDTAFAAAIKNMAMGCVTKEGKKLIHGFARPGYQKEKCQVCGKCVDVCNSRLITLEKDGITINLKDCSACGRCVDACPNGALEVTDESVKKSYNAFAAAAKAVVSQFPPERIFFITVLKHMTELCDCAKDGGKQISPDIGFIAGRNPLELDLEAARLIREKNPKALNWKRWEWFVQSSKKYF